MLADIGSTGGDRALISRWGAIDPKCGTPAERDRGVRNHGQVTELPPAIWRLGPSETYRQRRADAPLGVHRSSQLSRPSSAAYAGPVVPPY